ncbi:MAG: hypothetical protein ACI4KR_02795 [Ruminiclostridium sp.]
MIIKTFGDVSKPKMLTLHPMIADGESMMRIQTLYARPKESKKKHWYND